ncbi:tRNA-intron lyase [Halobacteria archaeon AArc-curdl1]|uniref:tRNA-splicing endonuclease n=1 Tax=Natronosalvus hydrolyticus TaxID=2979988 RepID=A0AAP2Z9G2_9EURY|nr:tRNA-intron lyase [Halobacteria archaeon AArc-curdl1]
MTLEGRFDGDVVRVAGDARQRFHDARGYGYPLEGNEIALAPVEAAHLLYRGDIAVVDTRSADSRTLAFRDFLAGDHGPDFGVQFLVYADLRSRGFYLSPAREPWLESPPDAAFAVFPRGSGPSDGEIEYALQVVGERTDLSATDLQAGALAVVDEESEITYFEVSSPDISGDSASSLPTGIDADLLEDRVVVWNPPETLYERTFYGQPLEGREYDRPTLQCSLLEAAHLSRNGALELDPERVLERGRTVEGDRFDRRLAVYTALRAAGVVPKTGYKFGADFRTYASVESVDELGHSELLIRVHPADHVFEPRDIALDVRLAHGVRKTMVFALVDSTGQAGGTINWLALTRLTP